MSAITAIVKNRRIEFPAPEDLPDGTEVVVRVQDCASVAGAQRADGVDESDTSPEGIRKWIEWSERPKPDPSMFDELSAILSANRALQKQWTIENWDKDAEKLRRMFE